LIKISAVNAAPAARAQSRFRMRLVAADSGILGALEVGVGRLQDFRHLARFFHRQAGSASPWKI